MIFIFLRYACFSNYTVNLVSSQAIVQRWPKPVSFSEMKSSVAVQHSRKRRYGDNPSANNDISIGCGAVPRNKQEKDLGFLQDGLPTVVDRSQNISSSISRRRLQHGVDPSECSNSAKGIDFYCWMQCPILKGDDLPVQDHLDQGESIYCLNESVLVESKGDVAEAISFCTDEKGVVGGVMDAACVNIWHPTVEGAFSYLSDDNDDNRYGEKYCYGATSMYMHGFVWEASTCIVYLFQPWVITTRFALVMACFGTIFFGIAVEVIIRQRRLIVAKIQDRQKKVASSAVLYAIQLAFAYGIMLIVMTYSGPLVLCVIIGLVAGHVISFMGKHDPKISGSTPCCATDEISADAQEQEHRSHTGTDEESLGVGNCCT